MWEINYRSSNKNTKIRENKGDTNFHHWYSNEEIENYIVSESKIRSPFEGKDYVFRESLEATDLDVVCIDTRMRINHMIQVEKTAAPPYPVRGFRAKILQLGKRGFVVLKKRKMTALLYGTLPVTRLDIITFTMKGRGRARAKKLLIGIANPKNHQGGLAFATLRYKPYMYLPDPINDYGIVVIDMDVVGWSHVPSREEVYTAVGTCLRKVSEEITNTRYVAILINLIETRSLIPAPTTQAQEILITPATEKFKLPALVWPTATLPLKDAELIQLG